MKKEKKKQFWATIGRIVTYAKPHKSFFYLACIFDLLAVGLNTFLPIVQACGIDKIIGKGNVDFAGLGRILLIIGVQAITSACFEWFAVFFEDVLVNKTSEGMRNLCFKKIHSVPLKYIDNNPHGDMMNTVINDIENVTSGFLSGFRTILSGITQLISCIIFMIMLNWQLTIAVVILAPITLLISTVITKRARKLFTQVVDKTGKISAYTEEMLSNLKIVKAYNIEKDSVENFEKINKELYKSNEKATFYASMATPSSRFIDGSIYGIIGCIGAFMCIAGNITVGGISAFVNYSNKFTSPFEDVAGILADMQTAIASAHRVFDLLDQKNMTSDKGKEQLAFCNGNLEIKNVYFSYTPQVKLIENFNLKVKKGQHIAIVGPTGCGKSTLINLLMRFYDVDSGKINISGKDYKDITRNSLRKCYGMVLQDSWLYNASIKDNIAYGKPDASMEEIIEASKLAGTHTFIEKLPNGYNTIIDENADNISAGQKQLLCIARIMLIKPPMLILDEATSNIDTHTEKEIQKAFDYIMEGRTCFVIAHRLSTIVNSDLILVMNKGNIIEQGTHRELMDKQGFYYNLYNSQFSN